LQKCCSQRFAFTINILIAQDDKYDDYLKTSDKWNKYKLIAAFVREANNKHNLARSATASHGYARGFVVTQIFDPSNERTAISQTVYK
jgi:hypothetical protein